MHFLGRIVVVIVEILGSVHVVGRQGTEARVRDGDATRRRATLEGLPEGQMRRGAEEVVSDGDAEGAGRRVR